MCGEKSQVRQFPEVEFRSPVDAARVVAAEQRLRPSRADIFVWEHEDDSRRWVARDLQDYLGRSLADEGDDWFQ